MKVLFATYSLAFQNPGGGERVMFETAEAVRKLGHQVDLYNPWTSKFSDYDLVHYFSVLETGFWNALRDQRPALPLVVTPTFKGEAGFNIRNRILQLLEAPQPSWNRSLASRSQIPDLWLPTTATESACLTHTWHVSARKCFVVPNAVSDRFFNPDPAPFRKWSQFEKPFALHVGRFHPVKNQLKLIRAFKKTKIPLLLIGGADLDHLDYFQQCSDEARGQDNIRLLGSLPMDSDLLPSAYSAAKLFLLPSEFETYGLAAFEAVAAGVPHIYVTQECLGRPDLEGHVRFIDPDQLENALPDIEADFYSKNIQPRKAQQNLPRWNEIAKLIVGHYSRLLNRTNP
ncbi:MAG: glycosyltransferase family 4 protein [Bdellovibrionales bacterium]|nr:glycosyltransferase family 4 protein [Oligoflexia bacterium]